MAMNEKNSDSNNNNSELNKIPDSDVLIPTSNIQNIMETAYKMMLNNVSGIKPSDGHNSTPAAASAISAGIGTGVSALTAIVDYPQRNATGKCVYRNCFHLGTTRIMEIYKYLFL